MPPSQIYQAFKRAHCEQLKLHVELPLEHLRRLRVKKAFIGERSNLPYYSAATYPGEARERIEAVAILGRARRPLFSLQISWFRTGAGPVRVSGKLGELIEILGPDFGDKEVFVTAEFSYPAEEAESLFKPIELVNQPVIFDSIIGFTGIKRNPEGKLAYRMEVAFEPEAVRHEVSFTQTVKLSEDTPLLLVETAGKISALALKPKVE